MYNPRSQAPKGFYGAQVNGWKEFIRMANTSSAKKMVRKIERRTEVNKNRRSRMRTYIRKVEEAIEAGDQAAASAALREAQPEIIRTAKSGILHANTASRKVSRLAKRVGAMSA